MEFRITLSDELSIRVKGDYTPAIRGSISRLPENCYPDEPASFDIDECFIIVRKDSKIIEVDCPYEIVEKFEKEIYECANERAFYERR